MLELIQNSPGITAERLAERLGTTDRAVRRYVGVLRDAGVPVESAPGRYGGYRLGRGHRVPPLMFTDTEALALVMAALAGHPDAADPAVPVGSALAKIIRVLPDPVARPADAVRRVRARPQDMTTPDPETTAVLVQAGAAGRRLRLDYRDRVMDVDPWAVVVRNGRWYLLCWSHARNARRVLRVDRVARAVVLPDTFTPPADLDPVRALEEHLSQGWRHEVTVVIDAPEADVAEWLPRSLGHLTALGESQTRLTATTDNPHWYAHQLTVIRSSFRVVGPPELRTAVDAMARRLSAAARAEH
jgi:predicted DNA-binding transcriptional regulator YafY